MPPRVKGPKSLKRPRSSEDLEGGDTKKKKKQNIEVPDAAPDSFDRDTLIDIKTDICAMCKGNHEVGLRLKEKVIVRQENDDDIDDTIKLFDPFSILDVNGVWASKFSLRKSQRMFVHYYCGLNSPLASFDGKEWCSLSKEVLRAQRLKCRYCGLSGASLGCLDTRCHVVMHVPCAVKLGFRRCGFKVSYLCHDHLKANQEKELVLDAAVRGDLSKGVEPVPVTFVNELDQAHPMQTVEYAKKNLDSVDVSANLTSIHNMACCACEGLCDDVVKCACLAQGRNYTFTGGLIPGANNRLLECNLRCSCSIRRCSNRVVEKGLTARLEVFRVAQDPPHEKSNTWGVRTLDFIPKGAFVCEITGQYVLGKTRDRLGGKATDAIISNGFSAGANSNSSSNSNGSSGSSSRSRDPYSAKITPVGTWDEGALLRDLSPDSASASASGSASASRSIEAVLDPFAWAAQQAADQVRAARQEDQALQSEAILLENDDLVRKFLDGQLCIDSRRFGNVGSFIRRRPAHSSSSATNVFTIDDVTGVSSSCSSSGSSKKFEKMLEKRLVYTCFRPDGSGAKLALFAARSIDAGTELLI